MTFEHGVKPALQLCPATDALDLGGGSTRCRRVVDDLGRVVGPRQLRLVDKGGWHVAQLRNPLSDERSFRVLFNRLFGWVIDPQRINP
jgi:hypothetical protein